MINTVVPNIVICYSENNKCNIDNAVTYSSIENDT